MATTDTGLFTESELRALLGREEGQFLEFKSLWDLSAGTRRSLDRRKARDVVAESVAAFANADGGILLLGVEDDGTLSGHGYPAEAVTDLLAVPERRLRPALRCRSQRATLDGHEIFIVQVPIAPEAVMVEANGFPYRVGDRVVREPQEVINVRKEAYRRVGYEPRIRAEASLHDVDLDLVARFFKGTVFRDRGAGELLERYGLVLPRAGSPAVTNACLLLFAKTPVLRWHPRAGIRFFRVTGKERRHGPRRNVTQLGRVDPPLAAAIPEAHRLAREQIRRSEKLHDLFFREVPEYPEFAWQEAIVNAFAHRDYEDQSREIEVWFFDDRMEVKSPGEPVPPVTIEALRERRPLHASRNPLLVRVLADAGLMRDEGEGIRRMFEEMEGSFLHAPELGLEAGEFSVTLRNDPIFVGPGAEWQAVVERLPLAVPQKRVLLAHPEGFTNEDYRRLNQVDRDEAYRQIQEMVRRGVLLPAGAPGRGAVYRPAAAGLTGSPSDMGPAPNAQNALPISHKEVPAWLAGRLPGLREYFTRQTFLTNADYRTLFEVTRERAKRELGRFVLDGFLRIEGERRGARYLPGPNLERSQT